MKELTPEFFYMPEFLVNSNYYHLGVKQDGEPLCDVTLPPWAKVCLSFVSEPMGKILLCAMIILMYLQSFLFLWFYCTFTFLAE